MKNGLLLGIVGAAVAAIAISYLLNDSTKDRIVESLEDLGDTITGKMTDLFGIERKQIEQDGEAAVDAIKQNA